MKIYQLIIIFFVSFCISPTASASDITDILTTGTSSTYQHDMDIVRLQDAKEIASLIETYRQRNGHYPLVGKSKQINYVYIATPEQEKQIKGTPPYPHVVTPVCEFQEILSKGLKREVKLPFDPQRRGVNKPNFYIYMVVGDDYYLAVHLHENFTFTRKIADYYNKFEVSSAPAPYSHIYSYASILKNTSLNDVITRTMHKPKYVAKLRNQLQETCTTNKVN